LQERRLLYLSPFDEKLRRSTAATAHYRNLFTAALADRTIVAHAESGSGTERFCREIKAMGMDVATMETGDPKKILAANTTPPCGHPS